jgi:hypothetical protein
MITSGNFGSNEDQLNCLVVSSSSLQHHFILALTGSASNRIRTEASLSSIGRLTRQQTPAESKGSTINVAPRIANVRIPQVQEPIRFVGLLFGRE